MRVVRYTRWEGQEQDGEDLDQILSKLSDFFLGGRNTDDLYHTLYYNQQRAEAAREQLAEAIERLIQQGDLPEELLNAGGVEQLLQRLQESDYIQQDEGGFHLTRKGLDLVSHQALRDLLSSLGKQRLGRHESTSMGPGIENAYDTRGYEFGDPLHLDVVTTLLNSARRRGRVLPFDLEESDLEIYQSELQSHCATVLMLDTSHSMILYGEDRFTPAKRVALALSHLIRNQFPGDDLSLVLFHNDAEQISPRRLAEARVGPYFTNTRAGLRLAQAILAKKVADNRQIIMITDGKPSLISEGGRVYRGAWGLNPFIVAKTLDEVRRCRNRGIVINTFMLARDYELIEFVKEVSRLSRGRAYFTTPQTLGQYLMIDFLSRKNRRIG